MGIKITNTSNDQFAVGDIVLGPGKSTTIDVPTQELLTELARSGTPLHSSLDFTPFDELTVLSNDLDDITDSSGGTAATPADGAVTVAAISDTATTADAVATLIAELTKQKALNTALISHISALETMIARLQSELLPS